MNIAFCTAKWKKLINIFDERMSCWFCKNRFKECRFWNEKKKEITYEKLKISFWSKLIFFHNKKIFPPRQANWNESKWYFKSNLQACIIYKPITWRQIKKENKIIMRGKSNNFQVLFFHFTWNVNKFKISVQNI